MEEQKGSLPAMLFGLIADRRTVDRIAATHGLNRLACLFEPLCCRLTGRLLAGDGSAHGRGRRLRLDRGRNG